MSTRGAASGACNAAYCSTIHHLASCGTASSGCRFGRGRHRFTSRKGQALGRRVAYRLELGHRIVADVIPLASADNEKRIPYLFNLCVHSLPVSTRSLQHSIVLAGAEFGIAGDHPTLVFKRLS